MIRGHDRVVRKEQRGKKLAVLGPGNRNPFSGDSTGLKRSQDSKLHALPLRPGAWFGTGNLKQITVREQRNNKEPLVESKHTQRKPAGTSDSCHNFAVSCSSIGNTHRNKVTRRDLPERGPLGRR